MTEFHAPRQDPGLLAEHERQMREAGSPEIAIRAHLRALRYVFGGGSTLIPEESIEPVKSLPSSLTLGGYEEAGRALLDRTVVIKLNGGLGTGMGLSGAKSLLEVRRGKTFLDLIAQQVLARRRPGEAGPPLVLMNSERTRNDCRAVLARYPELVGTVPLDFLQHEVPRVDPETGGPLSYPESPQLEWCPPGHGDLYAALMSSGMLEALRSQRIRYAFVSNADNLGAVLDLSILGWFASQELPFLMEVARRTTTDRKGGHLAFCDGRLVLREIAQCSESDRVSFQDTRRHPFFNTNNLWLDLDVLAEILARSPEGLALPIIENPKPIRADDPEGRRCVQLETAMGAAIECFEGAQAIFVPRERFRPVKTTSDLLAIASDAYQKGEDGRLIAVDPSMEREREIVLDPRFYESFADYKSRFPFGAPSLVECRRLTIVGDFRFGAGVSLVGDVRLENPGDEPVLIPDGARLGD